MLRVLFGETPREWTGRSLETVRSIEAFARRCSELADRRPEHAKKCRTFEIWAEGLLRSMNELEQSCYAAKKYALQIGHSRLEAFTPEERTSYERHVYFDKNAYIRFFAVLDKLGTLLNQLLALRTERIKSRYSYFTVLRNMRQNGLHTELMKPLNEIKERHQAAMSRLRSRRNTEIHQMNAELRDDLQQSLAYDGERRTLEDLGSNMEDLDQGWAMVRDSLHVAFRYACGELRRME
ncbi:Cthe_2314 family HEPN domain-containing protein [Cohnella hongkongensis]|uniref:Cthe_2314 family HEPN domain-containing protein n=1 Tax=Cohnella hongkongensis TaxID=178337 RepID=A0ABV9F8C1_9BACL